MSEGYNGYRNYETFTVSVELTNNRGLEGLEAAREVLRGLIASHEYRYEALYAFRDWLPPFWRRWIGARWRGMYWARTNSGGNRAGR
jgi:hypothetical protein